MFFFQKYFCTFFLLCALFFVQGAPRAVADNVEDFSLQDAVPQVSSYVLRAGDKIGVFVYGEADLSRSYDIGPNGVVIFPLVGAITMAGLSLDQASDVLKARLADGYLVDPNVILTIAEHRPVSILGEVRAPGSYAYSTNMSVLNLVALAGGYTYRANRREVEILRPTGEQVSSSYKKMPAQSAVEPGDIILIKERFF